MYRNMNTDTDLYTYTDIHIHAGAGRATAKHAIYTQIHMFRFIQICRYINMVYIHTYTCSDLYKYADI